MKDKVIKLKTVFLINNFILGTLAIVAAGSLVAITTFLHEASLSSERSLESLRVTEEFKVGLLAHNRLALLQTVDPSIDYSNRLLAVEAGLNKAMKVLDSFIDDAAERSLVERVKASTRSYFLSASIKDRLHAPRVKSHIRAVDELDEAYAAIGSLRA